MLKYFAASYVCTGLGLILSAFVGYYYGGTAAAAMQALFITSVLAVLEVSLSFDNAIVNAVVLKKMTAVWRHRFLTWGMLIAVFGMRLVFPLAIVAVVGKIDPWSALVLAATQPDKYAELMLSAHLSVAAFGGAFLLMVTLNFFYDTGKELHWIPRIEKVFAQLGRIKAIEIAIALVTLMVIASFLPNSADQLTFIKSALAGVVTYVIVGSIGSFLEASENSMQTVHKASAGMFLYLEVLDASFSFDGVVGAFAITHNLFIIMIGLSIGAFFVRSLTILFVEKDTLNEFAYLEHGAFYAIGILASIMLVDPFLHIPEWVTGLLGGVVIVIAFIWSVKFAPTGSSKQKQE